MPRNQHRQPIGHSIQPVRERCLLTDQLRIASQHQKRGLKHILDIVGVPQHPPTDPQYETAVPAHQLSERGLIPMNGKQRKQFGVGLGRRSAIRLSVVRPHVHRGASIVAAHRHIGRGKFKERLD